MISGSLDKELKFIKNIYTEYKINSNISVFESYKIIFQKSKSN